MSNANARADVRPDKRSRCEVVVSEATLHGASRDGGIPQLEDADEVPFQVSAVGREHETGGRAEESRHVRPGLYLGRLLLGLGHAAAHALQAAGAHPPWRVGRGSRHGAYVT